MCMSLTLEFNVVLTIDMEGPQGDLVIVCVSHDESVNDGQTTRPQKCHNFFKLLYFLSLVDQWEE